MKMQNVFVPLFSGLLFGFGLALGGMGDPANVIAFLDIFGAWNPQLAFVMGGAVVTTFIGFKLLGAKVPVGGSFKEVDRKLIAGSALFGIGWGLSGLCPGPAILGLNTGAMPVIYFVGAMLLGMFVTRKITSR